MNISTLDQVFDKTVKTLRFLYFDHTLSLSSQSSSPHQARAEHQQTEVCTLCRGADAGGAFDVSSHHHHYCTRPPPTIPPYHQPQTSYTLYIILYIFNCQHHHHLHHQHHFCTRPSPTIPPYHQPQTSYTLYNILYIFNCLGLNCFR